MDNYALVIKEQLMAIITDMASRKEEFVKVPGKDFTRTRKKGVEFRHRSDIYKVIHYGVTFDYLESIGKVYYPMSFRIVRVKISEKNYHTFITNLDSEALGTEQIKQIYHMRWGHEGTSGSQAHYH